jgi:hypothetical protein
MCSEFATRSGLSADVGWRERERAQPGFLPPLPLRGVEAMKIFIPPKEEKRCRRRVGSQYLF